MSQADLPSEAEVVIVGGGIIGCSIAYHLTRRRVKDVVVLERRQLTCGTTWHAAGLVSMLWPTPTLTTLAKYCHELYASLEAETGQATGYKRVGSLSIARTEAWREELRRTASMGKVFGVDTEFIDNKHLEELYPGINTEGILGCMYNEKDGQTNPIDTTMALARGARMEGALVLEHTPVEEIRIEGGAATGVRTARGDIRARKVVLTGGLWSRDIARTLGIHLPLYACEHYYVVTEGMPGLTQRPVMRDFLKGIYLKEDAGKMLVGWFEKNARGCPMSRIGPDFCFDQFETDMAHIEPYLVGAMETFPAFGEAGIATFFNGPESFTPDNLHLMGPAPQVENFWVACGMNSKGIAAAGGLGRILADWMVDGYPSGEITETDVRRFNAVQCSQRYIEERIPEALGRTYSNHWPFYQYQSARKQMMSPVHHLLERQGACFGEVSGYERANWFARNGATPEYVYSYKRSNWFDFSAAEHMAVRQSVGIYDLSSFGKFALTGPGAEATLQRLSCADVAVQPGGIVYTQWLNERGGIEADLTIARIAADRFHVITSVSSHNRDWWRLKRHLLPETELVDFTTDTACLCVQGPNARALLQAVVETDLDNDAFPFATGRYAGVAGVRSWMQRLSYVGELGWELFVPARDAPAVLLELQKAGRAFDITNVGLHAVNSLRLEKGFRHWGHDISAADNLVQAGLSFVARPDASAFIGREAFLASRKAGAPDRRMVQFRLNDSEPLLY
ncbi:MAG: FAD-dependent oxidoreductase, partial [Arenicellales bacterium]